MHYSQQLVSSKNRILLHHHLQVYIVKEHKDLPIFNIVLILYFVHNYMQLFDISIWMYQIEKQKHVAKVVLQILNFHNAFWQTEDIKMRFALEYKNHRLQNNPHRICIYMVLIALIFAWYHKSFQHLNKLRIYMMGPFLDHENMLVSKVNMKMFYLNSH